MTAGGKTVLFAWELGGGFGHARKLARVAAALAADGHRPVFACRDATGAWPVLRDLPWPILPAPHCLRPAGSPAASFADVLAANGYAAAETLAPLVRGWDGLLAAIRPALVVADFAPTACLAAAGAVPVVDVGTGFCQPPRHRPTFPPLDPRGPTPPEAGLLAVVRGVQAGRGRAGPATLPGIFADVDRCVSSLPELDPYRDARAEPVVGPLEPLPPLLPLPDGETFFAYLDGGHGATRTVLARLAAAGLTGEVYVRGETAGRPPLLADALARHRVVVHHGGAGTAAAAVAAGRPQLVLPAYREQWHTAVALHALGVAHYLAGDFPPGDAAEGVRQLARDPAFAERAADLAERTHRAWPAGGLSAVLDRCRDRLA